MDVAGCHQQVAAVSCGMGRMLGIFLCLNQWWNTSTKLLKKLWSLTDIWWAAHLFLIGVNIELSYFSVPIMTSSLWSAYWSEQQSSGWREPISCFWSLWLPHTGHFAGAEWLMPPPLCSLMMSPGHECTTYTCTNIHACSACVVTVTFQFILWQVLLIPDC